MNPHRLNKLETIIIVICVVLIFVILGSFIYLAVSHPLEYRKPHRYMELTYDPNSLDCSREEVRNDLNELFGTNFYIYREEDMSHAYGVTNPFHRVITIDADISIELYAFYLAHELVHLTHFTASERYCNFIAFKVLYNTDKYRNVAIRYAIQDRDGGITSDYSCWEYIFDYLIEEMNYDIL